MSSPALHTDFTFGRAGGRQTSVIITAAGDTVMYQGRKYKRKSHQVMSFRSDEGSGGFCDCLTITELIKAREENLYDAVTERFNKSLEVIM